MTVQDMSYDDMKLHDMTACVMMSYDMTVHDMKVHGKILLIWYGIPSHDIVGDFNYLSGLNIAAMPQCFG